MGAWPQAPSQAEGWAALLVLGGSLSEGTDVASALTGAPWDPSLCPAPLASARSLGVPWMGAAG